MRGAFALETRVSRPRYKTGHTAKNQEQEERLHDAGNEDGWQSG